MNAPIDKSVAAPLLHVVFGHSAFQFFNAACELGLFNLLNGQEAMTRADIAERLKLCDRSTRCLLSAMKALKFIEQSPQGFHNSSTIARALGTREWQLILTLLQFQTRFCYAPQQQLLAALVEGRNVALEGFPGLGTTLYEKLEHDPKLASAFYCFMGAWSEYAQALLTENFDFSSVARILDVGGGDATNAIHVARAYPRLTISVLDLPNCCEAARARIAELGMANRIDFVQSDFFREPFPNGYDCFLFCHQIVIWSLPTITDLLHRAFEALPMNGVVILLNSMADVPAPQDLISAMFNAYFLTVPSDSGMLYDLADYTRCLEEAGFTITMAKHCGEFTPHCILVGSKQAK